MYMAVYMNVLAEPFGLVLALACVGGAAGVQPPP